MGKWANFQKTYRKEWEKQAELKDWLKPVDSDPTSAYCPVCKSTLRAHLADLKRHAEGMKHKAEMRKLLPPDRTPTLERVGKHTVVSSIVNCTV
jgi:hypothetical protein